jgi:hypothetical protein
LLNEKSIPKDWPVSKVLQQKAKHYFGYVASALLPRIHFLYSAREKFDDGLSAVVITKDDIWLSESLKSIEKYTDELVIVDSSSSEYLKRNKQLLSELHIPLKKHIVRDLNKRDARRLAYENCTRNWILIWDGDVVAMDNGINDIANLIKYLKELNRKKYYYKIFFPQILIGKNFREVQKQQLHLEAWVVSNSKHFKWDTKKIWDRPIIPLFFKKIVLITPYALHINHIRPLEMEINRTISIEWYKSQARGEDIDYETFYNSYPIVPKPAKLPEGEPYSEHILGRIPKLLQKYINLGYEEILNQKHQEIFGGPPQSVRIVKKN